MNIDARLNLNVNSIRIFNFSLSKLLWNKLILRALPIGKQLYFFLSDLKRTLSAFFFFFAVVVEQNQFNLPIFSFICIIIYEIFAVSDWDGDTLEISRISRLDMGAYLCIASNGVHPSVSKRIKVSVDCEYARTYLYKLLLLYVLWT